MMAADVTISADIEVKQAIKNIDRLRERSERAAKDISKGFTALKVVAAGAVAVFASGKLASGIKAVTDAAGVQEDAVKRLNTALGLSGEFSDEASRDMQRFASELQKVTTQGDETTLNMLALSKAFGANNQQAQDLVTTAADMSSALGIDAESAVRNLGKTFGGLSGELGELIPELKTLTQEQLKAGDAIALVAAKFGGAAISNARTFSGSVQQLSNSFGDFQEELGEVITKNPVIVEILQSLKTGFENLGGFIDKNSGAIRDGLNDGILSIVGQAPNVIKGLSSIAGAAIKLAKGFNTLRGIVAQTLKSMLTGIDGIASAFQLLLDPIDAVVLGMAAVQKTVAEFALGSATDDVSDLQAELDGLNAALRTNSGVIVSLEEIKEKSAELDEAKANVADLTREIEILDNVGQQAAVEIGVSTEELKKDLEVQVDAAVEADLKLTSAEKKLDELTAGAVDVANGLVDRLKQASASGEIGPGTTTNVPQSSPFDDLIAGFVTNFKNAIGNFGNQIAGILTSGIAAQKSAIDATAALQDERAKAEKTTFKELEKDRASYVKNIKTTQAEIDNLLSNSSLTTDVVERDKKLKELRGQLAKDVEAEKAASKEKAALEEGFANKALDIEKQKEKANEDAAAALVGGAAGLAIDTIAPGLGQVAGPLIGQLASGGAEAATEMVTGLADAIPGLINNLVEAVPAIVLAIADNIDKIIPPLIGAMPRVAFALAKEAPKIALSLAMAVGRAVQEVINDVADIINDIGSFNFAEVIGEGFSKAIDFMVADFNRHVDFWSGIIDRFRSFFTGFFDKFAQFGRMIDNLRLQFHEIVGQFDPLIGVIDDLFRQVSSFFGGGDDDDGGVFGGVFGATGGEVGGTGNRDNQGPFALMPGELIIDKDRAAKLDALLDGGATGGSPEVVAMLASILTALQSPQTISTEARVNDRVLADIILQLNRSNARLTA